MDKSLEVSSYKWFDEYNWIYSVNDDGIYVYNCANKNISKLADIDGKIVINKTEDNKIIYNEDKEIIIEIN